MFMMKEQFISLIFNRLNEEKHHLKNAFSSSHPIKVARHFALDNLLPTEIAEQIYTNFPKPRQMRMLNSRGELKLKYSHIKNTSNLLKDLHHAIQDPKIISLVEEITGIKNQRPDTSRLAGGITTLTKGHYINPHLDNSHDIDRKYYRTVNLLYYVSPGWKLENGGNYELWDEAVENHIVVPSLFNRLVVMETNRKSWHAVNPVVCDASRCCVFNYYFSEQSPEGEDYFHTSSMFFNPLIKARPEQKIRRKMAEIRDRFLRQMFIKFSSK
jgi:Rps23 Pro-64 3,4-dihydroxylase Tpa1-like proline 4-hydroxylase